MCASDAMSLAALSSTPGEVEAGHPQPQEDFGSHQPATCLPSQLKDPRVLAKGALRSHFRGQQRLGGCPNSVPSSPRGAARGSSVSLCSPGKAPPAPASCQRWWGAGWAPRGSFTRERGDLGANLELVFPKPFQTPRLLAGSAATPASPSSYTMSFHWQGQQRGKNNAGKQGTCDGELG